MSLPEWPQRLLAVLQDARAAGFLGPGPVEAHLRHARGFVEVAEQALGRAPDEFCDLGTGGGIPGLVLALAWPAARGVFIDSTHRRCAALRRAIVELGLEHRIEVIEARAEAVAHDPVHRERFAVVTARSFAGPAVTAEIAAGLVAVGGVLVVSEPPDAREQRWSTQHLGRLGFGPARYVTSGSAGFVSIRKDRVAPSDVPRSTGRPAKRPLW